MVSNGHEVKRDSRRRPQGPARPRHFSHDQPPRRRAGMPRGEDPQTNDPNQPGAPRPRRTPARRGRALARRGPADETTRRRADETIRNNPSRYDRDAHPRGRTRTPRRGRADETIRIAPSRHDRDAPRSIDLTASDRARCTAAVSAHPRVAARRAGPPTPRSATPRAASARRPPGCTRRAPAARRPRPGGPGQARPARTSRCADRPCSRAAARAACRPADARR